MMATVVDATVGAAGAISMVPDANALFTTAEAGLVISMSTAGAVGKIFASDTLMSVGRCPEYYCQAGFNFQS